MGRKLILSILLLFVPMLAKTQEYNGDVRVAKGDINGDGYINSADVVALIRIIMNQEETEKEVQKIDSADVHIEEVLDLGNKFRAMQGMTVWGNYLYQFYSSSRCRVFNLLNKESVSELQLPEGHYGSVAFSNEYGSEGEEIPLLYVGGSMAAKTNPGYTVVNMNTGDVSSVDFDSETASQVLCVFDFDSGIGYSFGYKDNDPDHEAAPYEVTPFDISTGKCDVSNRFFLENEGHLQDAFYDNGKIWICTGWSTQWNGVDIPVKIVEIDPVQKITTTVLTLGFLNHEAEGIAIWGSGFLISMRKSYKVYSVLF